MANLIWDLITNICIFSLHCAVSRCLGRWSQRIFKCIVRENLHYEFIEKKDTLDKVSEETRTEEKGKMLTLLCPCCAQVQWRKWRILRGGLPRFWRLVHTRFQISNKEFVIMSMKDISVQLELKYIEK